MPKSIDTLVADIYGVFEKEVEVDPKEVTLFGERLGKLISERLKPQGKNYLRLSNAGSSCLRRLWYSTNCPELGEKLSGPTRLKFLIGDVWEAVVLFLARVAGHTVEDEQAEVEVDGVQGHLDAIVDNEVVDVKSASPYSFKKFQDGLTPETDAFGYLTQLGSYAQAKGKRRGHFLAANKVLGHLHLDTHEELPVLTPERVAEVRTVLEHNEPPPRGYDDEPDGKSGNRKLGVACSYCSHKDICWPGLKTYAYANGPKFLTKVVREPRVDGI